LLCYRGQAAGPTHRVLPLAAYVVNTINYCETYFTSPFIINTLPHHQKCSHDSLCNVYVTPTETGL
jgi:hypothetical protein